VWHCVTDATAVPRLAKASAAERASPAWPACLFRCAGRGVIVVDLSKCGRDGFAALAFARRGTAARRT